MPILRCAVPTLPFRRLPQQPIAAALLLLVLAVAGCGLARPPWQKPGASVDQVSADYEDCLARVRHLTQRDYAIDTDIAASRGSDWRNTGNYQSRVDTNQSADAAYAEGQITGCMTAKGYAPKADY